MVFQNAHELERLEQDEAQEAAEEKVVAQARRQLEVDAAARLERKHIRRVEARKLLEEQERQKARKQLMAAREGAKRSKERVQGVQSAMEEEVREVRAAQSQQRESRVQAVVRLKKNIESVKDQMRAAQDRKRRAEEKKRKAREEEWEQIVSAGGNPYEIFRRREMQEKLDKGLHQMAQKQRQREAEVMSRLQDEDRKNRRQRVMEQREKKVQEEYVKSLGRAYTERLTEEYITSKTLNHEPVIDPTGRMSHLFPSQVTCFFSPIFCALLLLRSPPPHPVPPSFSEDRNGHFCVTPTLFREVEETIAVLTDLAPVCVLVPLSQHMVAKDWKFGTGTVAVNPSAGQEEMMSRMLKKHKNVTIQESHMPGPLKKEVWIQKRDSMLQLTAHPSSAALPVLKKGSRQDVLSTLSRPVPGFFCFLFSFASFVTVRWGELHCVALLQICV